MCMLSTAPECIRSQSGPCPHQCRIPPSFTGASSRRLLREVAALRSRLAEASAEHMSRPEFPLEAPDSSPSAAREAISSDALNSSDSRLEALQAEAHLLQDSLGGVLHALFKHQQPHYCLLRLFGSTFTATLHAHCRTSQMLSRLLGANGLVSDASSPPRHHNSMLVDRAVELLLQGLQAQALQRRSCGGLSQRSWQKSRLCGCATTLCCGAQPEALHSRQRTAAQAGSMGSHHRQTGLNS